jgi:hypothetical protein
MRELKDLGVLGFEEFFQELGILEGQELTESGTLAGENSFLGLHVAFHNHSHTS